MKKLLALSLFLLILVSALSPAFADSDITVRGTGAVQIPADIAVVSLGVSAVDRDVLAAQTRTNEAIAAIRAALTAIGIAQDDISTDYISINALYDYSGGMEELRAYSANSTLAIRITEIDRAGEVIDAAFEAGANTLNGISFSALNTEEAREKALKAAFEDAKAKAEILAGAAGLKLRGIEEINEGETYSASRTAGNYFAAETAKDAASATVVQAAKITVSASVSVTFDAA